MITPGKIVCVGRNYRAHAQELGNDVPAEPLLFLKPPSALLASGAPIRLPAMAERVEYEGEIGLLIGRRLRRAPARECEEAVRAVVAANDVTARDLQRKDGQWTRAKGFDTFCPIGEPAPITGAFEALTVVTRVNGAERQRGTAAEQIFPIPVLLSFISHVMTLEPGDLVLTGTPAGVGPLAPGDEVEVELVGASRVRNPVAGDE